MQLTVKEVVKAYLDFLVNLMTDSSIECAEQIKKLGDNFLKTYELETDIRFQYDSLGRHQYFPVPLSDRGAEILKQFRNIFNKKFINMNSSLNQGYSNYLRKNKENMSIH